MHNFRNLALWILVGLGVVLLFNLFQGTGERTSPPPLSYSQFRQEVVQEDVKRITMQGDQVKGELANGAMFTTTVPTNDQSLWTMLEQHRVNVVIAAPDDGMPTLLAVLLNWFPLLLLTAVLAYVVRHPRPAGVTEQQAVNWRRGLLRSWVVASVLWLCIWAGMVWSSCQSGYMCWLGPLQLPGLLQNMVPIAGFTAWTWMVLVAEGLFLPLAVLLIGSASAWALDGFHRPA